MRPIFVAAIAVVIGVTGVIGTQRWLLPASRAPNQISCTPDQHDKSPVERAPGAQPDRDTVELRAQLQRLSVEVATLRQQVSLAKDTQGTSAALPLDREQQAPAIDRQQQRREWHEHMTEVQAEFQSEATDAAWASVAQSALLEALKTDNATYRAMRTVECRSQTCRLELSDNASGTVNRSLSALFDKVAPTLPSVQTERVGDTHGDQLIVVYLSRENNVAMLGESALRR